MAIRKNLLVHKTQGLGFLQPCEPSARFPLSVPPKGVFKAEWRQLSFFIVLILTCSQMSLLCKPLPLFFALKYFPGFPFAVTILSLLLGAGTISFMGHKCFLLGIQNLPSSYCAFPVYYKVLQPHPLGFALNLPPFLLFLTFSQFSFSSPGCVTAEDLALKFSWFTPFNPISCFPCISLHPSTSLCSTISLFGSHQLPLPLKVSFACSGCWILNLNVHLFTFQICRVTSSHFMVNSQNPHLQLAVIFVFFCSHGTCKLIQEFFLTIYFSIMDLVFIRNL